MDALARLLTGLLWHSARLVPARRRDWVEAVLAETEQAPAGAARVAWLCGGLRLVAREAVMGRMPATVRLRGRRPVNKAVRWAAFAPVPPLILVASLLSDNGLVYGVLAPIAVICLVGWLLAGIMMLTAWRRDLLAVGGEPVQTAPARWSAATRARLAWVGVGVLYGVVLPGVLAAAAIPGYAPVGRAIATAVATYLFFWLLGIGLLLVARPARVDPDDEGHRVV